MRAFSLIIVTLIFQIAQAQNPYPTPTQADLEFAKQMMGKMNQQYQNAFNDPNLRKQFNDQASKAGIDQNLFNKEIDNSINTFSRNAKNANTAIEMTQCMDITNPQFQQRMAEMEKRTNKFQEEVKALCASGNKAGAIAKQAEFALWAQSQKSINDANKCMQKFKDKFDFPEPDELETSKYKNSPVPKDICESLELYGSN